MAKLYYRYGAMNSGKSTALMQVAHNYEEQGMRVLILKPKVDTKGSGDLVSVWASAALPICWCRRTWTWWRPSGPPAARAGLWPVCSVTRASSSPQSRPNSCSW